MAVNAPPQYKKAEEEYRRAQSVEEQVACLEKMLVLLPKHKASEKVQSDLKTRLKEARAELAAEKAAPKKFGKSFRFPRQGAGQIVVLGGPNAGKSRLLAELTSAKPEVAPYPFTTREPQPGMMPWEDVSVQLIDMPPITDTHFEAYLANIVRTADAALVCFDGSSDDAPDHTAEVIRQIEERKTVLARESGFVEDDLTQMFGEKRFSLARDIATLQRRVTTGRLGEEVYPLLLLIVLIVFCGEHFVANWFYSEDSTPAAA